MTRVSPARLFEALPIPVVISDASMREIVAANPVALELYGYGEDELVGATPPFPSASSAR